MSTSWIGAEVARVHKTEGTSTISQLNRETTQDIEGFLTDTNNPHTLNLNARETFFKADGVILVEGQEDVVYYPKVLHQLAVGSQISGEQAFTVEERLFGWGAGGADKMAVIVAILSDLGFRKVAGIVDSNRDDLIPKLKERYPNYRFLAIPADDVRTKKERPTRPATSGLLDGDGKLRPEFVTDLRALFQSILGATE